MYIARFSYFVLPVNRQRAVDFIQREVKAAQSNQLTARLLVPLTRGPGGAALQLNSMPVLVGSRHLLNGMSLGVSIPNLNQKLNKLPDFLNNFGSAPDSH
jgi:hypothetical protein